MNKLVQFQVMHCEQLCLFFSFGLYIIILPLRLDLWCLQTFLCYWKYALSFLGVQILLHQALHFFFNLFPLSINPSSINC
jgi:hypothetical protein